MLTADQILAKLADGDFSVLEELSDAERQYFYTALEELESSGKSKQLSGLWELDYEEKPVPFPEFIEDKYYLGEVGEGLYPIWKEELTKVHDPSKEIDELIIRGSIGIGKCLGKGTPVLMFDGTIKPVENIVPGDVLMGDDNKPRRVLSTTSGVEELYEIEQLNGDSYVVNKSHILSLKSSPNKRGEDRKVVDIPLVEYLELPEWKRKNRFKGFKVPINWESAGVPVDPYFVGLWIGDGVTRTSSGGVGFSIGDADADVLVPYLDKFSKDNGFVLNRYKDNRNKVSTYAVCLRSGCVGSGLDYHWLNRKFKDLQLMVPYTSKSGARRWKSNKRIPRQYLVNDEQTRLQLLAGLLDADGHLCTGLDSFDFTTRIPLAEDVKFLCRSLGFKVHTSDKNVRGHKYIRFTVSGNVNRIPCLIPKKQAGPRNIKKDPLVCGVKARSIGAGKYYGFEIDGNGRFLLGDFTVTHNTTIAVISLIYKIYQVLCLREPQRYFDLMRGSPIVFGLFNVFKYLAESTAYRSLVEFVKLSPYFRDAMGRAIQKEHDVSEEIKRIQKKQGLHKNISGNLLRFPKGVTIAIGSQAIGVLGQNLFGGLLDEADMGKKDATDADRSGIAHLYGQARSRMDSRFAQNGGINPGLLILVSQVRGVKSFLEGHIRKMGSNPRTAIYSYPIWRVKPDVYPIEKGTFKVVVGSQTYESFIVDPSSNQKIPDGARVLDVPIDLRDRFEYSLDDAIRDMAGVPTHGANLFIPRRDKIQECLRASIPREHPFSVQTAELSIESTDTFQIADVFQKSKCMVQRNKITGAWTPKWYPGSPRAVHVDLAKNNDCAGIAMGCIGDVKRVKRYDDDGMPYWDADYTIFKDFALRIRAKRGSQIDFSKIRKFVFYLADIGFPIKWFSSDSWQSVDTLQTMHKFGFETKTISVDRNEIPYGYTRTMIYEIRLDMYEYEILIDELTQLEDFTLKRLPKKPPVDHPPEGSKDVSDGLTGMITRLVDESKTLQEDMDIEDRDAILNKVDAAGQKKLKASDIIITRNVEQNPLAELFDD